MRQRIRMVATALSVLLVAAAMSGCARIPTNGAVEQGAKMSSGAQQDTVYYPSGPVAGASAKDTVNGFLAAGTGTSDNHRTAREFLTSSSAISWDSSASTMVTDREPVIAETSEGRVRVSVTVTATVDANGRYTELLKPEQRVLNYQLERVNNEWRIAALPDGIVLLRQYFTSIFNRFTLAFLDTTKKFVVPEVRWFPSRATAPTRIVQALLEGPSPWLAEGDVKTAFPSGTRLVGPVLPQDGVAKASFTSVLTSASASDLGLMKLQLEQSLKSTGAVTTIDMYVSETKVDARAPDEHTVATSTLVNPLPLVVKDDKIGYFTSDGLEPVPNADSLDSAVRRLRPTAGSIAARVGVGAFRVKNGIVSVPFTNGGDVIVDNRPDVLAPTIGPNGFIMTTTPDATSVRVSDPIYASQTEIKVPEFAGAKVKTLAFSRSGTVLSALLQQGDRVSVASFAVVRDGVSGRPIRFGKPQVLPLEAKRAVDLTWVDATTLAVLTSDERGKAEVFVHQLGGETKRESGVDNGVMIDCSNTHAGLRILDNKGGMYVPRGSSWQASGATVTFLVAQS